MTTSTWLARVRQDQERLVQLLRAYHPASPGEKAELPITARAAEQACAEIRQAIAETAADPVTRFNQALAQGDIGTIFALLHVAWIGVPESTACWSVPGFREAVALLEEVPVNED